MSFRHFETGLRLTIDKNTNIPKVETVDDSRIYFSKCSKRKAFATVRGFENQQVFVEFVLAMFQGGSNKTCCIIKVFKLEQAQKSADNEKDSTIKNLNKQIDLIFYLQCVRNYKLNRTLKIA